MRAEEVPFRDTRIFELKRLDGCERALASAYRWHALRDNAEAEMLQRLAALHDGNAALLRARLNALGGRPETEATPLGGEWLLGAVEELASLRRAEQIAIATYHDHLGDFDPETAELVRELILPAVRMARDYHERCDRQARISEL